ncbi:MAG TPA: hypothetical protein VG733_16920 [Chthoniobacteraceae bacterium]|nr:hypothetical protein [Chthoniobacteraceae bacterium]
MNNSGRLVCFWAVCFICVAGAARFSLGGEPPVAQASPSPSPASAPPAPEPLTTQPSATEPSAPAATPAPEAAKPPAIAFNAQNKEVAKSIYLAVKQIQDTEFDPSANMTAINKMQDIVAQTDFSDVPQIKDYVKASLTLNTLRSRDIKIQRSDAGKNEHDKDSKTDSKISVGPFALPGAGVDHERSNSAKNEQDSSSDVSISSQNDPAVLDKARQQQATAYGFLLDAMKRLGFARPIDPKNLVGRWKWRCTADEATYEFDFREDGTVYVKLDPDKPANWPGRVFANKGRGTWKLDYRALSLKLSDQNLAGFLKQRSLIFFANKEIVNLDDEKMVIATDEDNELKRIDPKK